MTDERTAVNALADQLVGENRPPEPDELTLLRHNIKAVGGVRRSAVHPSKSAVLGLCAAAQGIRRDEEAVLIKLAKLLKFGVKVIGPGTLMADYHTVQAPPSNKKSKHLCTRRDELREPKIGTLLSSREYRQDALALTALWQNDGGSTTVEAIASALSSPVFHLYLGRKSCPLGVPLNPKIISTPSLTEAFDAYPEPLLDETTPLSRRLGEQQITLYWESCDYSGMADQPYDMRVLRHDQPLSRKRWQFTSREETIRFFHGSEA